MGVQAAADVDGLAGGQQLVGEDVLRVLQDHLGLTGSGGTHGDDVFLVGGGGDGVDGSGVSVNLVLADHGSGSVLNDHEAGVDAGLGGQERGQAVGERGVDHTLGAALGSVGQLARGDAEEVERQGHGLAMEVTAGDNGLVVEEHQRVIGDGVELDLDLLTDILERVAAGAVQLRDAAQGVSVLNAILLAVVEDLGAVEQLAHIRGDEHLALLTAHLMDAGVEGVAQTGQALEGHGRDHIAELGGADGVVQSQSTDGGHRAGAVRHAEAFLGDQGVERLDAGLGHGLSAAHLHALVHGLALAEHGERHMSERSQVAGGAEGALLRDNGGHALVEHLEQHLHEDGANAAHAAAQRVGAQQHHAADDLVSIRLAGGGAVAEDQVGGELIAHLLGDGDLLELAEARGDAVGDAALGSDLLGQGAGLLHGLQRGGSQLNGRVVASDGDKGFERQAVAIDDNVLDRGRIHDHGSVLSFLDSPVTRVACTCVPPHCKKLSERTPCVSAFARCGRRSARGGSPRVRSGNSIAHFCAKSIVFCCENISFL